MRRILSGGEPEGREIWTDDTRCNTLSRMVESLTRRTEELHCRGRLCLKAKRWRFDGSTREGHRVGERAEQEVEEQAKQVVENRQSRGENRSSTLVSKRETLHYVARLRI